MLLINFGAEPDLREAAHAMAREKGISLSAFIRQQLRHAIREQGKEPPPPCLKDNRRLTHGRRARG